MFREAGSPLGGLALEVTGFASLALPLGTSREVLRSILGAAFDSASSLRLCPARGSCLVWQVVATGPPSNSS